MHKNAYKTMVVGSNNQANTYVGTYGRAIRIKKDKYDTLGHSPRGSTQCRTIYLLRLIISIISWLAIPSTTGEFLWFWLKTGCIHSLLLCFVCLCCASTAIQKSTHKFSTAIWFFSTFVFLYTFPLFSCIVVVICFFLIWMHSMLSPTHPLRDA